MGWRIVQRYKQPAGRLHLFTEDRGVSACGKADVRDSRAISGHDVIAASHCGLCVFASRKGHIGAERYSHDGTESFTFAL